MKINGLILFFLGLILNICMMLFGFWPSLIYIIFMIAGFFLITLHKKQEDISRYIPPAPTSKFENFIKNLRKSNLNLNLLLFLRAISWSILTIGMLVVLILAISKPYMQKRETIRTCNEITAALELFKKNKKDYPPSLEILIGNDPIRSDWTKDAWNKSFLYQTDAKQETYILISAGKDGKMNTSDDIIFKNSSVEVSIPQRLGR